MDNSRPMTWDELCAEMVKQRKRAEKALIDNRRLQKRLKKLEDLMGEAPLDDWICQQDPDFETRWNKALQHKEGE